MEVEIQQASSAPTDPVDQPDGSLYSTCIHCGLCLNACPTYRVLGTEMDSPRGRIFQIAQVDQGNLELSADVVEHLDRCLDCRACETACPSGVRYGEIIERARGMIERDYQRAWLARHVRDFLYKNLLLDFAKISFWAKLLRLYQRSSLRWLARKSGFLRLLGLESLEALAPEIDQDFYFQEIGMLFPASGERRGRVAFLAGCIASVSFADLNVATVSVLQENGWEVMVPRRQACCGALHIHAGYRDEARRLAQRNLRAFLKDECVAIVTNAAGCGSAMKGYRELLEHDPDLREQAQRFSGKVRDVTEFLVEHGLRPPLRSLSRRVTYQDPCHLAHAQKVRSAPREALRHIGATLVEMPNADQCCGSAGSYNITQHELSMQILDRKMDDILPLNVDVVTTANVGCMLQLRAGVKQRGAKLPVRHVVELLDDAY